jgi:uncharacterized membrane protein
MQLSQIKPKTFFDRMLIILIIIILASGIFFRFANLDKKVYWGDETATSLRISGYTLSELQELGFLGEEMGVKDLQKYQYPNQEKNLYNLIVGLAKEEPQHPPLYFILARFWVKLFGHSVAVTRSISAVLSLLAFPCIYWLCRELFKTSLPGWLAMALLAVSPIQILYAQEARSYSLWSVTVLLSSAALLKAIRLNTRISWLTYAISLTLGLYTIVLSVIVAIGQGIFVIFRENFRLTKIVRSYLWSSLVGFILFFPWILAIIFNVSEAIETTDWTRQKVSFLNLLKIWLLNISRIFFDVNYNFTKRNSLLYIIILLLFFLVIYSIYFLCRYACKQAWLFVLILIGTNFFSLVLPDLILGGIRSGVARYLFPFYLSIQIAVAYLLASKMSSMSMWQQKFWRGAAAILISLGIYSSVVISPADSWWNKYIDIYLPKVAEIVNQTERPIVITGWHSLMSLSHILKPNVSIQSPVSQQEAIANAKKSYQFTVKPIANDFSDIFVYSARAIEELTKEKNNYRIDKVYQWKTQVEPIYRVERSLWKVTKLRE